MQMAEYIRIIPNLVPRETDRVVQFVDRYQVHLEREDRAGVRMSMKSAKLNRGLSLTML